MTGLRPRELSSLNFTRGKRFAPRPAAACLPECTRDTPRYETTETLPAEKKWEKTTRFFFPGQNPISDEAVTIAEVLKKRGYATAAIGKWGLGFEGSSGDPNRQGFDLFYGFNCQRHAHNHYPRFLWRNDQREIQPGNDRTATGQTYSQDRFTEVALEFIDANRNRPFFLYLPFAIPHLAIQVPETSVAEFGSEIQEAEYKHRGYIPHPKPRAGYAAMISHMDRDIGKIMQRIDHYGLKNDTLFIFTSDNGPAPPGWAVPIQNFSIRLAPFVAARARSMKAVSVYHW